MYTREAKKKAIDLYIQYDKQLTKTVRALGYPSPNTNLVNTMLNNAIAVLKPNEHPIIHSDRGAHYRWPGWINRMDEAGLIRSMSKKNCSLDN